MGIEELEARGLKLVISKDEDAPSPYDAFESMRTRHVIFSGSNREISSDFTIDLERPWRKGEGFAADSLYVYLHDDADIRMDLERREKEIRPMEAIRAADLARQYLALDKAFAKAVNKPRIARLRKDMDMVACDFMVALSNPASSDDVDEWFRFQMVPMADSGDWLRGTPFLDEAGKIRGSDLVAMAAKRTDDLIQEDDLAAKDRIRTELAPLLSASVQAIDSFSSLHRMRFGGCVDFMRGMRENFRRKFGAPKAAAVAWISDRSPHGRCRIRESFRNAGMAVFLHEKDVPKGMDAEEVVRTEAALIVDWLNGDVFKAEIVGTEGEIVESVQGFYGSDFELNGLNAEARRIAEKALEDSGPDEPGPRP